MLATDIKEDGEEVTVYPPAHGSERGRSPRWQHTG